MSYELGELTGTVNSNHKTALVGHNDRAVKIQINWRIQIHDAVKKTVIQIGNSLNLISI